MRNTLYIYLASLLMNALFLSIRAEDIHPCSGAGFWFPAGKQELSAAIDGYLNEAKKKRNRRKPNRPHLPPCRLQKRRACYGCRLSPT